MNPTTLPKPSTYLWPLFCLALPFGVFYWMLPFVSGLTLGQDYGVHAVIHQMHLLFSLKNGAFPLYIPEYAGGGQSAGALTQGYLFHPLTHLAGLMKPYWNGDALEVYTLINLISLGLTHWALFYFLRRLRLCGTLAFVFSLITVYNLRMLDHFRYGGALQNYNAFLMLAVCLGLLCLRPHRWRLCAAAILSAYLLVCGGQPQMAYYGLLGCAVLTVCYPFYLRAVLPDDRPQADFPKYAGRALFCVAAGVLLASAFTLPFYFDFMKNSTGRVGASFRWALGDASVASIANAFFRPLDSNVHGSFGGSSLFVPALLMPLALVFSKQKRCRSALFLWGFLIFVFIFTLGGQLPAYRWFWRFFPFASAFRMPERINLILPFILMLLAVWLIRRPPRHFTLAGRGFHLKPAAALSFISIPAVLVLPFILPEKTADAVFTPASIHDIPGRIPPAVSIAGAAGLAFLALREQSSSARRKALLSALLIIAVLSQITLVLRWGSWTQPKKKLLTYEKLASEQQLKPRYVGQPAEGHLAPAALSYILAVKRPLSAEPLARLLWQWRPVSSSNEAYRLLAEQPDPQRLLVEDFDPRTFKKPSVPTSLPPFGAIRLVKSSFNQLDFSVRISQPGFFCLAYPHVPNWQASVDGQTMPIFAADGGKMAIWLLPGDHRVRFRFRSGAAAAGMLLSLLTLWLFAYILIYRTRRRHSATLLVGLGIGAAVLCGWWSQSAYRGKDLGGRYLWLGEQNKKGLREWMGHASEREGPETMKSGPQNPN